MGRPSPTDRARGTRAFLRRCCRELAAGRAVAGRGRGARRVLRPAGGLGRNRGSAGDRRGAERLLMLIDRRAANGYTALRPLVLRCRGLLLVSQGDCEGAIASLE